MLAWDTSFHLHFLENLYLSFVIVFDVVVFYKLCAPFVANNVLRKRLITLLALIGNFWSVVLLLFLATKIFCVKFLFRCFVLSCLLRYFHFVHENGKKGVKKRSPLGCILFSFWLLTERNVADASGPICMA